MIAAIYARKSNEQAGVADEQRSVARQIEHAHRYAERKGWTISDAHVYVDDGISGAEFAKRPGFLRLMNALKPRAPFDVLIMSEESRLGREQLETGYALKQIMQAGVRVFYYLDDRERTLDSATDKILLAVTSFSAELEREKARQRTKDALERKARNGKVTGGRVFGYTNERGADGNVDRTINEREAAVIRQIFELCASGYGLKTIARRLNAQRAPSPRHTWAPSSVREALRRALYRGQRVWNQTAKRDQWGQRNQQARPADAWISVAKPELRIVPEDLWTRAHARLDAARRVYLKGTNGVSNGRPALGRPSKYLLTTFASCGVCGSGLEVRTRPCGKGRQRFYVCAAHHERGTCSNASNVPMPDADSIVLDMLLDFIDENDVRAIADEAVRMLQADPTAEQLEAISRQIATLDRECQRLSDAIANGGNLDALLRALQAREQQRKTLETERDQIAARRPISAHSGQRLRDELLGLASSWRRVLVEDVEHARPIIGALLDGRLTFTPTEKPKTWRIQGNTTLNGLVSLVFQSEGMASPTGSARCCGPDFRWIVKAA